MKKPLFGLAAVIVSLAILLLLTAIWNRATAVDTTPTTPYYLPFILKQGSTGPTATATPTAVATTTPTATATLSAAPTIVPTASNTPTAPPPDSDVIVIDELHPFNLRFEFLQQDKTHVWKIDLIKGDTIRASVAAHSDVDVALSLLDPDGETVIDAQNLAPAGEIETIGDLTVSKEGDYELHIEAANDTAGHYVVAVSLSDFFLYLFRGIITYGDTETTSLTVDADDFWHFYGEAGDNVTIELVPADDEAELFMALIGDEGELAEATALNGGETLQIGNVTIPADGMYSIRIGDMDFLAREYTITLTEN